MNRNRIVIVCLLPLVFAGIAPTQTKAPAAVSYHHLKTIAIGGPGGWDYAATDEVNRRLYVSHDTRIIVIDIDKDEVVGEITDTPGVHGFALAPELGLGFSSNGRESKASIVDLKSLKTVSKVETGQNPDGILYVPGVQEVYTFNRVRNAPGSATVFEAKTGKVITTIALPGSPEFAVVDTRAGRIYNNIDNKNEVVAIDIKTHQIVAEWPTAPGEGGSGMAIDLAHHRLFIGCDNLMVMMDSTNGKVVGSVPIAAGVDANRFDPATGLAFASCSAGTVTIAREENPDKLVVVQTLETARGSRTMTLDPKTHKIYLAAVDYEPAPAAPPAGAPPGRAARPQQVPNSFKVLVYGMDGK